MPISGRGKFFNGDDRVERSIDVGSKGGDGQSTVRFKSLMGKIQPKGQGSGEIEGNTQGNRTSLGSVDKSSMTKGSGLQVSREVKKLSEKTDLRGGLPRTKSEAWATGNNYGRTFSIPPIDMRMGGRGVGSHKEFGSGMKVAKKGHFFTKK